MKKLRILTSILLILSLLLSCAVFAAKSKDSEKPKAPKTTAKSAVLIDLKSGAVLYEKDADEEMYPASTTKILSYLVIADAIENGELELDDMLVFTADMRDSLDPGGSNIELKAGEKMSVLDLLRAMLIASGNDAATLLADSVSGNEKGFVEKMNQKAEELGLSHTHFTNPHGLTDENHYTTAKDLAIIAREAMKDKLFREIVSSKTLNIDPTNKTENERYYINTNNLISPLRYSKYYYEKATGIKTGYTDAAGSCLVASAKDGERELICVVLKSESSHEDAKALLEFGFDSFKEIEVVKKGDILGERAVKYGANGVDHVRAVAAKSVLVTVPLTASSEDIKSKITYQSEDLTAPVEKSAELGTASYSYDGTVLATVSLVAEDAVSRHPFGFLMAFGAAIWGSIIFRIIVYIILIALLLFILLVIYGFYRSIKKSRARARRRGKYKPPMY